MGQWAASLIAQLFDLSRVHPVRRALARFSRKEPNKHIKSASFLIKPDFIIIIAIVFHKLGQKVTLGPYLYISVHDTTPPAQADILRGNLRSF